MLRMCYHLSLVCVWNVARELYAGLSKLMSSNGCPWESRHLVFFAKFPTPLAVEFEMKIEESKGAGESTPWVSPMTAEMGGWGT